MVADVQLKLDGLDELQHALAGAAKEIRTKAVRGALRQAANVIKRQAQTNAPILSEPKAGRKPGTVRAAISVRVSKKAKSEGNEGVFVGVRPLKARARRKFKAAQAAAGRRASAAENPNDPYYWWWVEFGHRIVPRTGRQSLTGAAFGFTVYQQRLGNGRIVTRKRKYSHQSITGRRRASQGRVEGQFFITRAAHAKGTEAIALFMRQVVPKIEKLNAKAAAHVR